MLIKLKRVYEPAGPDDGLRVLVDRLWPRGLSKERAAVDEWAKDVAPSTELRKSWHGGGESWDTFTAEYERELAANPAVTALAERLAARSAAGRRTRPAGQALATLLYGAHDPEHNHAVILLAALERAIGPA